MRVEIPYIYRLEASYPPTRPDDWSRLRSMGFELGVTSVEIREVDKRDAPVVLKGKRPVTRTSGSLIPGDIAVRYFDGKFYETNRLSPEARDANLPVTADMMERGRFKPPGRQTNRHAFIRYTDHPLFRAYRASGETTIDISGPQGEAIMRWLGGEDPSPTYPTEITFDNRMEARATAERIAAGIVVIDGEVWRQIPEPVIEWRFDAGHRRATLELGSATPDTFDPLYWASNPVNCRRFRVAELDAVADVMEQFGHPPLESQFSRLKVLAPEVFTFDPERDEVLRTAALVLASTKERLGSLEDADIAAWTTLRTAYREAFSGEWTADVAETVKELCTTVALVADGKTFGGAYFLNMMEKVSARWQAAAPGGHMADLTAHEHHAPAP